MGSRGSRRGLRPTSSVHLGVPLSHFFHSLLRDLLGRSLRRTGGGGLVTTSDAVARYCQVAEDGSVLFVEPLQSMIQLSGWMTTASNVGWGKAKALTHRRVRQSCC